MLQYGVYFLNSDIKYRNREALLFILSYIKKYLHRIIPGILALIAVDFIQLIIPKIIQRIIDLLSIESFSFTSITRYSLLIIVLAVSMVLIRFLWRILIIGSARRIEMDLRSDMFSHLISLDYGFFTRTSTGKIMALMINDVNAIRMAAGPTLIALTDVFFMGVMALYFMAKLDAYLTLIIVSPLPVIAVVMVKFAPIIVEKYKKVQEAFSNISKQAQEAFSGIRLIKGHNSENFEISEFRNRSEEYVNYNMDFIKLWSVFFPLLSFLATLSLIMLLLAGGKRVITTDLSFGEFVSFSMYINLLVWPVTAIGWVFSLLQRGIASSIRVLELLSRRPEEDNAGNGSFPNEKFYGNISFEDVSLKLPGSEELFLNGVSFQINRGEVFGITGRPGAGKSLLLSLIFKLLPLENGKIRIDGVDVDDIPSKLIRKRFGYVPQDGFLFSDTIYNNIVFTERDVTKEDVIEVAKIVDIYGEILGFKDGFDTEIGERGVSLSGGQRQRISIARALIKNPDVLIIDDALSQVDALKEKKIIENILGLFSGRTIVIVSHRVSTLKLCDRIVIMERGKIIGEGTHEHLLHTNDYYRVINEIQDFKTTGG